MMPEWAPQRGTATIELSLMIGLLIVPLALAVLTIPQVVERQMAARQAAREVARELVVTGSADAPSVLARIEAGHGLAPGTIRLDAVPLGTLEPGGLVTVRTTVALPVLAFGRSSLGFDTSWTAEHTERMPDHGARR